VQEAVRPIAVSPWPYFEPGSWVPHITLAVDLADDQLAAALPIVARHLPIRGALDRGGVEDGSTGESWAGPSGRETGRD
jgi:hypothetical protein